MRFRLRTLLIVVANIRGITTMYDRFTDQARIVMRLANDEAESRGHKYICPGHIVLALLDNRSGVAAHFLQPFLGDDHRLRQALETMMSGRVATPTRPVAKPVIEQAIAEAQNLNHSYVGTEHFFLALLKEPAIAGAFVVLGLDPDVMYDRILKVISSR